MPCDDQAASGRCHTMQAAHEATVTAYGLLPLVLQAPRLANRLSVWMCLFVTHPKHHMALQYRQGSVVPSQYRSLSPHCMGTYAEQR